MTTDKNHEKVEILYRRIDELEADRAARTRDLLRVEQEVVAKTSIIRELQQALLELRRRQGKAEPRTGGPLRGRSVDTVVMDEIAVEEGRTEGGEE